MAMIAVAGIAGFGIWSTTNSFAETFCFNPTGYCGSNIPDPDRVGGPHWMVNLATPDERTTYFTAACEKSQSVFQGYSCVEGKLREDVHGSCVTLSPKTYGENAVTRDEETIAIDACKTMVLASHGLELNG